MRRPGRYAFIIVILLLANLAWHIYAQWGLITVHADKTPLRLVMKSIEKQGHVLLRSNMPGNTEVTMRVDKVGIAEALDALSAVTDTRWRLTYLIAPAKPALADALAQWENGKRPENWKPVFAFRNPAAAPADANAAPDEDAPASDPRREVWDGKPLAADQAPQPAAAPAPENSPAPDAAPAPPKEDGTLRAWLKAVAQAGEVAFSLPGDWNPPVAKAPGAGEIRSVVPKLASAAGGQAAEVFLLTGRPPRAAGEASQENRGGGDDGPRGGGPQDWLNSMPPEQRAQIAALMNLPPEQRRAQFSELRDQLASDPAFQQRIIDREDKRSSYRTPAQRLDRYRKYVARKAAAAAAGK